MRVKRYRIIIGILAVVLFLFALAAQSLFYSDFEYKYRTRLCNKTLKEKEKIMDKCLTDLEPVLAQEDHHGSVSENNIFSVADQNEITILEYFDNRLAYWSDNGFDVPAVLNDTLFQKHIIFLQNGWFLPKTIQAGNEKIVGLLRLRTEYSFENSIITSGFEKYFGLSENVGITTSKSASDFKIYNLNRDYLFSLTFPESRENTWFILLPLCLWAAFFITLILLSLELFKAIASRGRHLTAALLLLLIFGGVYIFILLTNSPSAIFQLNLFLPYRFSLSGFIPSVGHLLILSILLALFSFILYAGYPFKKLDHHSQIFDITILTGLLLTASSLMLLISYLFSQLILNSNINLETFKITELDQFSALAFSSILLLFIIPLLFLLRVYQIVNRLGIITLIVSLVLSLAL